MMEYWNSGEMGHQCIKAILNPGFQLSNIQTAGDLPLNLKILSSKSSFQYSMIPLFQL